MGLVLDSSVAIAAERSGAPVEDWLAAIRAANGSTEISLSVVSVMELEHGGWRAREPSRSQRRLRFLEDLIGSVPGQPVTTEIARRAGRIDGEQQAHGVRIAFQDLVIGATALELGCAVVTHNVRHFEMIPGLEVLRF